MAVDCRWVIKRVILPTFVRGFSQGQLWCPSISSERRLRAVKRAPSTPKRSR